ncbi:hypothetical protein D3C72_606130 [compost metagenome]
MTSGAAAALLGAAAIVAVAAPAAAQDFNLAQALVDTGNYSGAELDFWVIAARHHRDRVEWRQIVERETRRMEAERAEAPAPQAQRELDPKSQLNGPLKDYLEQEEAYRRAEEAAELDPKSQYNGPLEDELRRLDGEIRAERLGLDPKSQYNDPLEDELRRLDREIRARRQLVGGETQVVQAVERWARVVVDSTGEVIENDPIDVAHARLEDLIRRQDELDAQMRGQPSADEFAAIIADLRSIDAELNIVLNQIGGAVWRRRSTHHNTCFPGPVPDRPVAVFNCHYWAAGLPRVVDATQNIILDRVRLDVDEDEDDLPIGISIAYFWRYGDNPPSDEPGSSVRGEVRHTPEGRLSLVFSELDENGNPRERSFPLTLTERSATLELPGFDGYGPFAFPFARDGANYVSWPVYQASARGQAPDYRRNRTTDIYDIDVEVLNRPAPPPPPPAPPPPPPEPLSEEEWAVPLPVGSAATPPAPKPPTAGNAPVVPVSPPK